MSSFAFPLRSLIDYPLISYYPTLMLMRFFNETFTWVMILIVLVSMQQRKHRRSAKKRKAILAIGFIYLAVYVLAILRVSTNLPVWTDWIVASAGIALYALFRKTCFPFRRRCVDCSKKLKFDEFVSSDENICSECYYKRHPEEKREEKASLTDEEGTMKDADQAERVDDIDWDFWEAKERCTLCYVADKQKRKLLLIEKKKGMGTGYLNAPGGHIELEETSAEAAVRETKEETGLDVRDIEARGILRFQFKEGTSMIGYIFYTESFSGSLRESDETRPGWYDIDNLDFERMWEDDRLWLPQMLSGKSVDGFFIFDRENRMLDYKIEFEEGKQRAEDDE